MAKILKYRREIVIRWLANEVRKHQETKQKLSLSRFIRKR